MLRERGAGLAAISPGSAGMVRCPKMHAGDATGSRSVIGASRLRLPEVGISSSASRRRRAKQSRPQLIGGERKCHQPWLSMP